jgi:predicted ATP-dependent endonuclease of OLD family
LGKPIFLLTPQIIYFDEFDDILPELFYIEDLSNIGAKGRQAVKDIESLSGTKFSELTKLSDKGIQKWEVAFKENLSLNFNQKWQQRIIDGDNVIISAKYYQGREDNRPYLRFFIETREGETLPPAKRSLGFKWFLSFYLRINAENKKVSGALLVFDEPGSQLHLRAQHDMLKLFEDLSKTNQIIYSTHSPYLIDTNKLSRVRLVFNTKKNGTVVEKITTKISANQKDAMKPIIDALGMQVAHDFSAAKNNNVIVEGISDHYYLSAAKKLLGITDEFYFMPAMGASNAHILMELCIGWGLDWLMIFDDKGSATEVKKIKSKFFPYDTTTDKKIYTIKGCDGIEDIFEEADIKLAQPTFARTEAPLKEDLAKAGTKELIGRFFLDKALSGEITWDNLSKKAQDHLKSIFNFIADGFLFF